LIICGLLVDAKMGEKGTGAKPMQTKPLEEDCSLKNVAMDAEGAARAQPNQLTPKLKKESNIGNNRVSTQNMENQVSLSQFMFMQDMMKQMAEMQRQAREDRERRHREHMEEMREDREREERRHAEHMEEMQRPYTRTKLAQNPNCNTTADVAVAPNVTSKPTETKKTICAIAEAAIAPTATTKAIEAKVPEAIKAQEMIESRVKATLKSVIQEDPLEHSEGKDTSGFPKVVPKVNAMKATKAEKHDAIKMAKTTKKATGVTKRSTKAKKPIGANKSKREKKTTNPLKRAKAAEKVEAPKAEAAKKPKAAKPKMTPAKKVRKNFDTAQRIWTKKKRKERWKHPWKEKRKERWKHPWKEKEEREMEASMERKRGKRDGSIYNILI